MELFGIRTQMLPVIMTTPTIISFTETEMGPDKYQNECVLVQEWNVWHKMPFSPKQEVKLITHIVHCNGNYLVFVWLPLSPPHEESQILEHLFQVESNRNTDIQWPLTKQIFPSFHQVLCRELEITAQFCFVSSTDNAEKGSTNST